MKLPTQVNEVYESGLAVKLRVYVYEVFFASSKTREVPGLMIYQDRMRSGRCSSRSVADEMLS